MTVERLRDLEDLKLDIHVSPNLSWLLMIQSQIEKECPDAVAWAVAYGKFFDESWRQRRRRAIAPGQGIEILVVTTLLSEFEAHMLLADKVFGPLLLEFAKLPTYRVWTRKDFKAALKGDPAVLNQIEEGVSIYGSFQNV